MVNKEERPFYGALRVEMAGIDTIIPGFRQSADYITKIQKEFVVSSPAYCKEG